MDIDIELWGKVIVPIGTFLLGYLVSRFTLSKKERFDVESQKQARSQELTKARDDAFSSLTTALTKFANNTSAPGLDEFSQIATAGEKYFTVVQMISDAILNSQLPDIAVKNTHLQTIKDVVERLLPKFFKTLQHIATSKGLKYSGVLRRSDYESIFSVYDKYQLSK